MSLDREKNETYTEMYNRIRLLSPGVKSNLIDKNKVIDFLKFHFYPISCCSTRITSIPRTRLFQRTQRNTSFSRIIECQRTKFFKTNSTSSNQRTDRCDEKTTRSPAWKFKQCTTSIFSGNSFAIRKLVWF